MAHGKTLELREIGADRPVEYVEGTEVTALWGKQKSDGAPFIRGWSRPMPFVGASRDRSLSGKARIRARRAAKNGATR